MTQESKTTEIKGRVFDIQRYSIQDGPGIRTTVFLKGCPLTCWWCSNPESQASKPQLIYFPHLCVQCHRCVQACPNHAIEVLPDNSLKFDRDRCQTCGACVEVCPAEARYISGKLMSVDEVVDIVGKDSLFYRNSGGGVTVSGGEPTMQPQFLLEFFKKCQQKGFHTTLDTCGYVKWEVLEPILEYVDLVLFDNKQISSQAHREFTGVENEIILQNARKIAAMGKPMFLRFPMIPGCNDSEENIKALAKLAVELGDVEINMIPYHKLGLKKYEALGWDYKLKDAESFSKEAVEEITAKIESYGARVKVI